ncbi:site-specific integrase [Paucibacter sp. B51]|uniref:site-specific integrase n=1 Tax=Paucibacter sp. B51 TaxID=2993315 RepID=UPI0022EC133D|nr:site-specific integrase [Paucibacter sp. B51]
MHASTKAQIAPPDELRFTRLGTPYRFNDNWWSIREGVNQVNFNFALVEASITSSLLAGLKLTLSWLLSNKAAATAQNTFHSFIHLLRVTARSSSNPLSLLTGYDLMSYRATLADKQGSRFHSLAILVRKWRELDDVSVARDAIEFLEAIRLKAPPPGEPVRTLCPFRGPLTAVEDEAFQTALNIAFASGKISEDAFFASWLTRAIGQRPSQTAALKVCDLMAERRADGAFRYTIRVPRAKKPQMKHGRESLKLRPLVRQIAEPLQIYLRTVVERFSGLMEDPTQAPMFPRATLATPEDNEFAWHRTGDELSIILTKTARMLGAHSERTGKLLHISPSRLRRTVGTRAAQEGHGEIVIAEILDHTNTASARYYVANVPQIVERIDAAVANSLAPLARAFQGLPPASKQELGPEVPHQIVDMRKDKSDRAVGQCTGGECRFLAPVACYTCRHFKPWIDGPHEELRDELIAQRTAQLARNAPRVAVVHDRTILAISQVIQICQDLLRVARRD